MSADPLAPGEAARNALTLHELVVAARRNLGGSVWDYLVGGAETETSVKRNRQALDSVAFRPRVLTDVSEVRAGGSLLGHDLRIPVILAPIGSLQLFEEGGGATAGKAAEDFGIMNFVSSVCLPGLEGTAEASGSAKVYQLYLADDEDWMRGLIRRAVAAGYNGFCLTVDTQVYSRRERDLLKRWRPPSVGEATTRVAPLNYQARMTWDLVKRIKDEFDIPLILKGIATAEDAGLACEHGVDVVYVSNHGGRQLDHTRGTLDTLPEVVEEVDGRTEVVVDGGLHARHGRGQGQDPGRRRGRHRPSRGHRHGRRRPRRRRPHAQDPRARDRHLPRPAWRHRLGRARRLLPPPRPSGRSTGRPRRLPVPGPGLSVSLSPADRATSSDRR